MPLPPPLPPVLVLVRMLPCVFSFAFWARAVPSASHTSGPALSSSFRSTFQMSHACGISCREIRCGMHMEAGRGMLKKPG